MSHSTSHRLHPASHSNHRSPVHSSLAHSRRSTVRSDEETGDLRAARQSEDEAPTVKDMGMTDADRPHPHMAKKFATSFTSLVLPIILCGCPVPLRHTRHQAVQLHITYILPTSRYSHYVA